MYANGRYLDIYDFRANVLPPGMDDPVFIFNTFIFELFFNTTLFLLGMAFVNMEDEKKWYKLGALLVPIGLACKSFSFIENNFSNLLLMGGSQLLAIGYVCLAALLFKSRPVHLLSPVFESVGKLSLTNYLMQTIICTTIFYEYGLGLYSKLGIVVYSLQCAFSIDYLKKFKRGPFETVLRAWTNWSWNGQIKKKGQITHE